MYIQCCAFIAWWPVLFCNLQLGSTVRVVPIHLGSFVYQLSSYMISHLNQT